MNSRNLIQIRFDAFKAQDHELGAFDVVFDIGGKKLYANKFMLLSISTTFASMISERWSSKDEPIAIETFGYDEFYQFLTFLYSNECLLTDDNILTMVDIAEFYQVPMFKDYCDKFLSNRQCTLENAIQLLETSNKYSLVKLRKSLVYFFSTYLPGISNSVSKKTLYDIIKLVESTIPAEHIFEKVYVWAEEQGKSKKELDQNLNLPQTIKEILADFMPLFDFAKMDASIAIYLAGQSILPPGPAFGTMLLNSFKHTAKTVNVKIINKNGTMMKGKFNEPGIPGRLGFPASTVYDHIQNRRNVSCTPYNWFGNQKKSIFWETLYGRPSSPTILQKNDEIEWYLVYDSGNCLTVKHQTKIDDLEDYLIAELVAEENFVLSEGYGIFATGS